MAAVAKERKTLVDKIGRKRARGLKYLLIAVPFMIYVFAFSYVPLIGWVYSIFDYKIGQRFLVLETWYLLAWITLKCCIRNALRCCVS